MAYPLHGESGKVTSVTNNTDLDQLLIDTLRNTQIVFQIQSDMQNTSGDGGTSTSHSAGLRNWSFNFTGLYPKAAPRIGNAGLVTYASGSTYRVSDWSLDFDFGEHDCTAFDGTAQTFRQYRPSIRPVITGTYTAHASSAAALTLPSAANAAIADATFKLTEDGTADPSFTMLSGGSGGILVSQLGFTTGGRELVRAAYSFAASGPVTAVAGDTLASLLPAGVVDMADWGDGTTGPSTVAATIELDASRTWACSGTGNWVYLRSLSIQCRVGELVQVSGVVRGSGTITPA